MFRYLRTKLHTYSPQFHGKRCNHFVKQSSQLCTTYTRQRTRIQIPKTISSLLLSSSLEPLSSNRGAFYQTFDPRSSTAIRLWKETRARFSSGAQSRRAYFYPTTHRRRHRRVSARKSSTTRAGVGLQAPRKNNAATYEGLTRFPPTFSCPRSAGKSFCRDRVSESFRPPTRSFSLFLSLSSDVHLAT